jgi:hypothetical protein
MTASPAFRRIRRPILSRSSIGKPLATVVRNLTPVRNSNRPPVNNRAPRAVSKEERLASPEKREKRKGALCRSCLVAPY